MVEGAPWCPFHGADIALADDVETVPLPQISSSRERITISITLRDTCWIRPNIQKRTQKSVWRRFQETSRD